MELEPASRSEGSASDSPKVQLFSTDRLKRALVGTPLGHALARARHQLKVLRALRSPEVWGIAAQDTVADALLSRLCRPACTFVDVGAHIGSVLSEVQRHDPSVQLIAIEAMPNKVKAIRRSFPHAIVHSCAVGEGEGTVSFFVDTERSGFSSLAKSNRPGSETQEVQVEQRRIDTLLPDVVDVDVIKIDVEGAELGALRGAEATIARWRPVVMFESVAEGGLALGYSVGDIFDWFTEHGYEVRVPNRVAHDGPALSRDGFIESHCHPRRTTNYFAVPKARRIEIRDRARAILVS